MVRLLVNVLLAWQVGVGEGKTGTRRRAYL